MTPAALVPGTSCLDWRRADAGDVVPLVRAEVRAWRETLSWDVAEAWSVVEPARLAGQLPGLVAYDDGRSVGWTAYLPHGGHLQVMALVARDARAAAALLDGLLQSAEARACDSTLFCVRDATPGLARLLAARGFSVDTYRYLMRDLAQAPSAGRTFEGWRAHDSAMAALCEAAYREAPGVRAFAPGGTSAEWRQYIATLVQGTACGWFLPELSFVVPSGAPADGPVASPAAALDACLMLTDLGTGVAHIAQLAVDPAARGRGLARQLVEATLTEAGRLYDHMSLLVSPANVAAVRLYESLGFRDHASFIVARS